MNASDMGSQLNVQLCVQVRPGRPQYDVMELERSIRHLLSAHPLNFSKQTTRVQFEGTHETVKLRLFMLNLQSIKSVRYTTPYGDVQVTNYLHFSKGV